MARFTRRDTERLRALRQELQWFEDGGPTALSWFLPRLMELVDADRAFTLELSLGCGRLELHRLHSEGGNAAGFRAAATSVIRGQPAAFGTWNPICPSPSERNRAISVVGKHGWEGLQRAEIYQRAVAPNGFGKRDQLRVLACDGSALLAWVGALRPRQAELLGHLARGLANKSIAVVLGCAETTVERHVTAILAAASVETRSMLLSRLLTDF